MYGEAERGLAFRIRPARAGDAAGCVRVWLDAARYYADLDPVNYQVPAEDGLASWFEQINAQQDPMEQRLVAVLDDAVVGLIAAVLRPPAADAERSMVRTRRFPQVYVAALAVLAPYRRSGVGSALMSAVERWGRLHGAALVSLDTNVHSSLSVPFYEQGLGYRRHALVFQKWLV